MIPSPMLLVYLRAHCRLHKAGMRHSKMTPTFLRLQVEHATCEKFKRGDWGGMIAALTFMIDDSKALAS